MADMDPRAAVSRDLLCGELSRSPAGLLGDWLRPGRPHLPGVPDRRCVVFTESGRKAILLAARLWGLGPADEVLAPAYNCGSEISPLLATGARLVFYRVDARAGADCDDIRKRITARTRLLYVTHYFGRYTDIGDLATLCRERGIRILDDAALSLFSDMPEHHADATVFSLRKSLPAVDGGILSIDEDGGRARVFMRSANPVSAVRGSLSLIKKWARPSAPSRKRPVEAAADASHDEPDIPNSYYCSPDAVIRAATRAAVGILAACDAGEIRAIRRRNYHDLRSRLEGMPGVTPLWPEDILPDGVCPLGLPVLVDDKRGWCAALNTAGIAVSPWWEGYHRGLDWSEFPDARRLKRHLLLLPVHQQLTARHIDFIAAAVSSLARGRGLPRQTGATVTALSARLVDPS
jgi:dTDP-4-amino-4,6-dideoxygalactose transaminase